MLGGGRVRDVALGGMKAVLLDALGTLLELEDPGPPLAAALGERGVDVSVEQARAAVLAEMTYYKAHHDEASDRERLADLRRRCAEVLRDELPPDARALGIERLVEALLEALRFRPYDEVPEALAALRASGLRLVVLSNWDVSLHDQLAATGLAPLVDGAVSSAEVGVGKPHPDIYARALEVAGAAPGEALMAGDSADTDVAGALALGIEAVLVDRWGGADAPAGAHKVASLAELPGLIESLA
jgi:putative hydrolase of the HAD superfamily